MNLTEKAGWTGLLVGMILGGLLFLTATLAFGETQTRFEKLHSSCTEDEVLVVQQMREVRKDVYVCTHPDNLNR